METVAKFVLSAVDLAEAELRSLQRGLLKFGLRLGALIAAGIIAMCGMLMLLGAFYLLLSKFFGDIAALAIIGGIFSVVAAGLLLWAFHKPTASADVQFQSPESLSSSEGVKDESAPIRMAS